MRILIISFIFIIPSILFTQDLSGNFEVSASYNPSKITGTADWRQTQSMRVGYLIQPISRIRIGFYVEYYWFDYVSNDVMTSILFTNGSRKDIAVYPSIRLLNIFEFAGGVYYSKRASIYDRIIDGSTYLFLSSGSVWHLYYHFGFAHSFIVYNNWQIMLGLTFHDQSYRDGLLVFALRAGISFPF